MADNYRIKVPIGRPIRHGGGSFTIRLDSKLAQRQLRMPAGSPGGVGGQYKASQHAIEQVLRQNVAPVLQQLHAHAFDQAVKAGRGRAEYRKGGAYAQQRPEQLLSLALRTDRNLWGAFPGGGGLYVEPDALYESPLARADGTRLADYWWVQDEGYAGHVGSRVAIKGSSANRNEAGEVTSWSVGPGFKSIRDMSKRRRYGGGDASARSTARITTVKNAIPGYQIFDHLLGETLRAAASENIVRIEVERALIELGYVPSTKGSRARLRKIGSDQAKGLGVENARTIISRRLGPEGPPGFVLTF